MNASLNQYQLDKKYNKILIKIDVSGIFFMKEIRKKADEQAYQILEMMQCLDLRHLDLYNSHYPLMRY
ncbi:hypothetical protein AB2762_06865 [Acinetobacter indicus]